MTTTKAGDLRERLRFERPVSASDGLGGTVNGFETAFEARGGYQRLRGSETVQAARLDGRQPTVITIRSFAAARQAGTDWRIVDRGSGEIFNIRSVTETKDRRWLEFLAESGVAT